MRLCYEADGDAVADPDGVDPGGLLNLSEGITLASRVELSWAVGDEYLGGVS